ncbi:hypothetical protein GCM10007385_17510 [Tateyamaria omphalii]|nr:hypothetical protein [Tateyamaria omphalii]GGX49741.1 hypothetical protein GCM10007385_17510 [Tateyamaria omphalii]
MLDFTNTPERRKRAAKARARKTMILMGLAIAVPAAAWAIDLGTVATLLN